VSEVADENSDPCVVKFNIDLPPPFTQIFGRAPRDNEHTTARARASYNKKGQRNQTRTDEHGRPGRAREIIQPACVCV